jgi:hypothetical protein
MNKIICPIVEFYGVDGFSINDFNFAQFCRILFATEIPIMNDTETEILISQLLSTFSAP